MLLNMLLPWPFILIHIMLTKNTIYGTHMPIEHNIGYIYNIYMTQNTLKYNVAREHHPPRQPTTINTLYIVKKT